MEGAADFIATGILIVIAAVILGWIIGKLADGFIAAIDFMTRNE